MHAILSHLLMTLITAALPQLAATDQDKRPDGPRPEAKREQPRDREGPRDEARRGRGGFPEVMFKRLDANHDGVVTADEIPAGAPPLKEALEKAVKSHDGKLPQAQFAEALRKSFPRPEGRTGQPQGQRPDARPLGEPREGKRFAERRPGRDEGPGPWGGQFGQGRGRREMAGGPGPRGWRGEDGAWGGWQGGGPMGWNRERGPRQFEGRWAVEGPWHRYNMGQWGGQQQGRGRYGRGAGGPQGPWAGLAALDPRAIFDRLDRDDDGKLSLDEFSAGLRRFQRMMSAGMQQRHAPQYSHFGPRGRGGWAMHQPWSHRGGWDRGRDGWAMHGQWSHRTDRHAGWSHRGDRHRAQFADWQGAKHKGKHGQKVHAKADAKKHDVKKPEAEKKAVKPSAGGQDAKAVEARLVAMKRQLEEREVGLMKLKKAEESLKANLAKLERQRDEMTARLHRAEERLKARELANAERNSKSEKKPEKKPADEKKPVRNL